MQFGFGSGIFWGTPLTDATGAAIANPTPSQLGVLQDCSIDNSWDTKTLYGQNQYPVAAGRGKAKMSGKAKVAQLNGRMLNDLIYGQTLAAGILSDVYDTTGAIIPTPSGPYTITPTVPGSGTWTADLGVRNSSGFAMTRVAATPATGQYSVSAGVYTFAAADTGLTVFINYQYTATSTTAKKLTVMNLPMGYAPTFRADIYVPYAGKSLVITIPQCIASKFSLATKQDDFLVPEFDFEGFADASGYAMYWGMSE